jgi:hypothetical protein
MQSFGADPLLETAAGLRRITQTLVDKTIAAKLNAIAADPEIAAPVGQSRERCGETMPHESEVDPRS